MAELHTTGVPTPFVLELSLEVGDCDRAERDAHEALSPYRVSGNREFFRVSISKAVEKILPTLVGYSVDFARESFSVKEIQEGIDRRVRRQEEENRRKVERQAAENVQIKFELQTKIAELDRKILSAKSARNSLGREPKSDFSLVKMLVMLPFSNPFPLGYYPWVGLFAFFIPGGRGDEIGIISFLWLFFAYLAWKEDSEIQERYQRRMQPFREADDRVSELENQKRRALEEISRL